MLERYSLLPAWLTVVVRGSNRSLMLQRLHENTALAVESRFLYLGMCSHDESIINIFAAFDVIALKW